jgi:outer membrane protein assembly factor BamB
MIRLTLAAGLACAVTAAAAPLKESKDPAPALAEWGQWRGPKRDGLSPDTGLLKEWPKEGPPLLWEARKVGRGYASLAITGGKIYTLGDGPSINDDKDEYAVCFSDADGKLVWKTRLGPPWDKGNADWQSSRSTPTVDGDLVYYLTAQGKLVCLETADGKERWRKDLPADFGGKKGDGWGYSESVLIDGDRLICTPGGEKATLVALDKKTGEPVWKTPVPGNTGAGHSSIVVAEVGKMRVLVQCTSSSVVGVRPDDGKLLWSQPFGKRITAVIPTPIVRGDLVFAVAGYGYGGMLLRQAADNDGGVKVEEVYAAKKDLADKHGGDILVGDYVYGDTEDSGNPYCAELMTGKLLWKKKGGSGRGSASIAYAEGRLYIHYADGTMVLAEASPAAYKEISTFKLPHSGGRPDWSHPVVVNSKLYVREGEFILCYDLKAK